MKIFILPGSADRIITMAEKEAEYRHDMETKAIEFAQRDARRGQTFAFIIVMASLIGGIILILNGDSIIGFASLISSLAILAGAFIYDNKKNQAIKNNNIKIERQHMPSLRKKIQLFCSSLSL